MAASGEAEKYGKHVTYQRHFGLISNQDRNVGAAAPVKPRKPVAPHPFGEIAQSSYSGRTAGTLADRLTPPPCLLSVRPSCRKLRLLLP